MSVVDEDVSMASGSEISSSDRLDEEGWVEPDWDEVILSYVRAFTHTPRLMKISYCKDLDLLPLLNYPQNLTYTTSKRTKTMCWTG